MMTLALYSFAFAYLFYTRVRGVGVGSGKTSPHSSTVVAVHELRRQQGHILLTEYSLGLCPQLAFHSDRQTNQDQTKGFMRTYLSPRCARIKGQRSQESHKNPRYLRCYLEVIANFWSYERKRRI
jgi:hypothetical protein